MRISLTMPLAGVRETTDIARHREGSITEVVVVGRGSVGKILRKLYRDPNGVLFDQETNPPCIAPPNGSIH